MENRNNKVDKYLDPSISEKKRKELKKEIQSSDSLRKELNVWKHVRDLLEDDITKQREEEASYDESLRPHLETIGRELSKHPPNNGRIINFIIVLGSLGAAAVLVFLIINSWTAQNLTPATLNGTEILAYNTTDRSNELGSFKEDSTKRAFQFYTNQNYAEALKIWQSLAEKTSNAKEILFTGVSLMHLGEYSEALEWFEKNEQEGILLEDVYWFSALTYKELGDSEKAGDYLCLLLKEGYTSRDELIKNELNILDIDCE